ncbi:MAG: FMN-binding negative transcriptional regulator [Flavobacteriaceae bacterium]
MSYPPVHHQESSYENIINLMQSFPLATIISSFEGQIQCSHTPLIFQANNSLGILVGHLDKFNPQLHHFKEQQEVELIFHGPDLYISPSIYGTTQLPTWNYFKAHLKGHVILESDQEKVKQSLIQMTAFLEGDQPRYSLDPDNPRMARALDYIVGFQIEIKAWEGKYKISQDKRKDDQKRAKQAMLKTMEKKRKEAIELLYTFHQTMKPR